MGQWNKVKGKDPNRHYVLANKALIGVGGSDYYVELGYLIETQRPDGPKLAGGQTTRKEGDPLEVFGHVLMSCTLERRIEIDEYGPDGQSGQAGADLVENKIIDKSRGVDLLRGIGIRGSRTAAGDDALLFERENEHNVHVPQ